MEFLLVPFTLLAVNYVLSRNLRTDGHPKSEGRRWLHKTGSWSAIALILSVPLTIAGLDDIVTARIIALAIMGLGARIIFLLALTLFVKDDSRRKDLLITWDKAAVVYVTLCVVTNLNNLLG